MNFVIKESKTEIMIKCQRIVDSCDTNTQIDVAVRYIKRAYGLKKIDWSIYHEMHQALIRKKK